MSETHEANTFRGIHRAGAPRNVQTVRFREACTIIHQPLKGTIRSSTHGSCLIDEIMKSDHMFPLCPRRHWCRNPLITERCGNIVGGGKNKAAADPALEPLTEAEKAHLAVRKSNDTKTHRILHM